MHTLPKWSSGLKALLPHSIAGAIGAAFALVRTSLQAGLHVPVSPVPIHPESSGRLAYLSGQGVGTIFGLARVIVANPKGSDIRYRAEILPVISP